MRSHYITSLDLVTLDEMRSHYISSLDLVTLDEMRSHYIFLTERIIYFLNTVHCYNF